MAENKTLSQLIAATGLTDADIALIRQSGTDDKSMTMQLLNDYIASKDPLAQALLDIITNAGNISNNADNISDNADDITGLIINGYTTGWVACNDWTNQHLGTAVGGNVIHNLNAYNPELTIELWISETGSDSDAFRPVYHTIVFDAASASALNEVYGFSIFAEAGNLNEFTIQTGADGLVYAIDGSGLTSVINNEAWYYKVVVIKLPVQFS